jgi:hypothetical protein
MKSSKFIFAISIFMASVSFSQPKISLDRPELDLGIVYGGARKKGRVVLKNIGTDTLKIMSVHTSCGCTTVKKPKDFLIPGDRNQRPDIALHDGKTYGRNQAGPAAGGPAGFP